MKPEREQHHKWEWKRGQAREREKTDWQVHFRALTDKGQGVLSVPDRALFTVIILSPSGIYKWSLFYSLYFSVLLYCLQWVCISFIIRENKATSKLKFEIEQILDWRAFFSGFQCLLTPWTGLGDKSVILCRQVDPPWVSNILRSLTPFCAMSCAGPRSMSHLRLFDISGRIFILYSLVSSSMAVPWIRQTASLSLSWFTPSQFFLPGPLKPLCHHTPNPLLL